MRDIPSVDIEECTESEHHCDDGRVDDKRVSEQRHDVHVAHEVLEGRVVNALHIQEEQVVVA